VQVIKGDHAQVLSAKRDHVQVLSAKLRNFCSHETFAAFVSQHSRVSKTAWY
jgi:hypothetical protein